MWRRIGREFGRLPSAEIQLWINDALLELDTAAYGNNIVRAQVYLACHLYKQSRMAEKGKTINVLAGPDADLKTTRYGRSLIRLRSQSVDETFSLLAVATI